MAQSVIGALRVNLGLDSAQFERGTGKAQKALRSMRNQFMAVAGAAAALGAAMTGMALRSAADIDRIVKAARRLDGSAGAFQALELAANEAGVSLSSLANDVQTMGREIAANSTGAQRALRRLGVSAQELAELDVDERVATIADRVQELGLSASEATALLRDLGIRNREMVLLMMQGGSAIRAARNDIRDYGLEIDDALGAKIEEANDRIARLGIVAQYFGQRLAAEIVPALGRFSHAITESMREGGNLRMVIDGLVDNMDRLAIYVGAVVTAFGVRYVAALAAARLATLTFAGSLAFLRGALIRTGIGALVVGAGELVYQFTRLVQATGSWGEALDALGDVARNVWEGIKTSAQSIPVALSAIWQDVRAGFFTMLDALGQRWTMFLGSIATGLRSLPFVGDGLADDLAARIRIMESTVDGFGQSARAATNAAAGLRAEAAQLAVGGFEEARRAAARLSAIVAESGTEMDGAAEAAARLNEALANIGGDDGGGGGGSAQRAADGVETLTDSLGRMENMGQRLEDMFASTFASIITGAQDAGTAISRLLQQLANMLAQQAFRGLFGSLFGGFGGSMFGSPGGGGTVTPLMSLLPGRADGGPVMSGRAYMVGERGPEMFVPSGSGHIVPNHELGAGGVTVNIDARGAVAGVGEEIRKVLASELPAALKQSSAYSADRRLRGFPA